MPKTSSPLPHDFEDCVGIFQGGGCRAAAYAGAYSAASARGVTFSEVAGTSAGSIAAVLIAAGATPPQLEQTLMSLDFSKLIEKPTGRWFAAKGRKAPGKIWNLLRFNGLHSGKGIEDWVEEQLRTLLPDVTSKKVRFRDLPKPVGVIAADIQRHSPKVWNPTLTPDDSVAEAVRSSCSIPFFFQPHGQYVDGGLLSNLPLHIVEHDRFDRRRILAFTLVDDFSAAPPPSNFLTTAAAVASTITDGGKAIQSSIHHDVAEIVICSAHIKATDFDKMSTAAIKRLVTDGRQAANKYFDGGISAIPPVEPSQVSGHLAQTLATIADHILAARKSILISTRDTAWVFDLYTALLSARLNRVPITIVLPHNHTASAEGAQQLEILRSLGCEVGAHSADTKLCPQAYVFDEGSVEAVALVQSSEDRGIHARLLTTKEGDEDSIQLLTDHIRRADTSSDPTMGIPQLVRAPHEAVHDALRSVSQYAGDVRIEVREMRIDLVDSWARYAMVYKQSQQREMQRHLKGCDLRAFEPYYVQNGNKRSLAMPIVVEENPNGRCTVVNGLSRLLLLKRAGEEMALCAVVSGVTAPAPANGVVNLSDVCVKVGKRRGAEHRYPNFVYRNVRKVEDNANRLQPVP